MIGVVSGEHARLVARQAPGTVEPPQHDVRVEYRDHRRDRRPVCRMRAARPSFRTSSTPRVASHAAAGVVGAMTSPSVSTECRKVSWGELDRLWSAAVRRASGFPRLVTSRGLPVRATSSSNARHRALKVEIATDFMVTSVDHMKHAPTRPATWGGAG